MSLSLGLNRSMTIGGRSAAWTPRSLVGLTAWYDPSDLSTMFQDTAGTTPVTADGQSVARINDKSGNGHNLTQATAANMPLYKTSGGLHWLQFDGTNDGMVSSTVTPGVGKCQVFAGVRKAVDTTEQDILEHGIPGSDPLAFTVACPASTAGYRASLRGVSEAIETWTTYTAPITNVLYVGLDYAGLTVATQITGRINGAVNAGSQAGSVSTGPNFGSYPFYVGRRGGTANAFNGNIYQLFVCFGSANLSAASISSGERFVATKSGVTF